MFRTFYTTPKKKKLVVRTDRRQKMRYTKVFRIINVQFAGLKTPNHELLNYKHLAIFFAKSIHHLYQNLHRFNWHRVINRRAETSNGTVTFQANTTFRGSGS